MLNVPNPQLRYKRICWPCKPTSLISTLSTIGFKARSLSFKGVWIKARKR